MELQEQTNTLSLKYVKLVRIYLTSVGSWPTEVLNDEKGKFKLYLLYRYYIILQIATCVMGQIFYVRDNFTTLPFFILGEVYAIIFLGLETMYRGILATCKPYGIIINKFVKEFHLIHFKYMGGHFETMYTKINKISHYFTMLSVAIMFLAMSTFHFDTFYRNFKNGVFSKAKVPKETLQFSIKYKWPGFDTNDYFVFLTCMNIWISYGCSVLICMNDVLLTLIVLQVIGHLEILNLNLRNFPQPNTKYYRNIDITQFSADENKTIHERIVACVNHHRMIVSFVKDLSRGFGQMLATNYLYHLVGCCLLLLECSTGEPGVLARYGPIAFIAFSELIHISVIFEIMATKSEDVINSVYSVPWESMDRKNQRSVYILLHRVQTPIYVTAMGLASVGVQTMIQILKTTFSYFAFLRSMD